MTISNDEDGLGKALRSCHEAYWGIGEEKSKARRSTGGRFDTLPPFLRGEFLLQIPFNRLSFCIQCVFFLSHIVALTPLLLSALAFLAFAARIHKRRSVAAVLAVGVCTGTCR